MARIPPSTARFPAAEARRRSICTSAEDVEGVDAGVTIPAQLTVNVFKDTQADGVKGAYEENFEGISVTLIHIENGEDAESVTYKTDEEGNVTFAGVSPGEYAIAYQLPGQWRAARQVSAASGQITSNVPQTTLSAGRSEPFTLTMGQTGVKMYIGAMLSGSISGVVYYDDDADAKLGANEAYLQGRDGRSCSAARAKSSPRRRRRKTAAMLLKASRRDAIACALRPKKRTAASPRRNAAWPEAACSKATIRLPLRAC